jgi:glycosyltransferase involved in cell wall biosynthesis
MLSVVIRNKNEEKELAFLLKNLTERYADDIDEIIVLDNLSVDRSVEIAKSYKARVVTIENFSYGGSANIGAQEAKNEIVVIFSAHAFPVSHDFFKVILARFSGREQQLAGLRCIHNPNDYAAYINGVTSNEDPNIGGLNFAASAFNKKMWKENPFKADIRTFEDKEWTKRMLRQGYAIEFVPAIYCYHKVTTRKQAFFRFKNEVVGGYQLHHTQFTFAKAAKNFVFSLAKITRTFFADIFYLFKRIFFMLRFLLNKPEQFK